ncbi:MAG TPA: carboxypeptidase regulatory-like domain-containing protein [Acidobacteriaceae bacterium]
MNVGILFRSWPLLLLLPGSAIAFPGAAAQRLSPLPPPTVQGLVTDTHTHQPIAGAVITLDQSPRMLRRAGAANPAASAPPADAANQQLTDAEGHFTFTGLSWGEHLLRVSKSGYIPAINHDQDFYQVELLPQGPTPTPFFLNLFLTPAAEITGQVTQKAGGTMSGVPLTLYQGVYQGGRENWKNTQTTLTDKDGNYTFTGLDAGSYVVVSSWMLDNDVDPQPRGGCSAETFIPQSGFPATANPGVLDFSTAKQIVLTEGAHAFAGIVLQDMRFHTVSMVAAGDLASPGIFFLRDQNGRKLERRKIPGYNCGREMPERRDPATGRTLVNLPDGTYTVQVMAASARGDPFESGKAAQPVSLTGAAKFKVAGTDLLLPPIALRPSTQPSTSVHVRLELTSVNADGTPRDVCGSIMPSIARIGPPPPNHPYLNPNSLWLTPADSVANSEAIPARASSDELSFPALSPGRYWVHVDEVGNGYVGSITAGGVDLARRPLVVGLDGTSPSIEVTLRNDCGRIHMVYPRSQDGRDYRGIQRTFYGVLVPQFPAPTGLRSLLFDPKTGANFMLGGLAPGQYKFYIVRRERSLLFQPPDALEKSAGPGRTVRVKPSEIVELPITAPPAE